MKRRAKHKHKSRMTKKDLRTTKHHKKSLWRWIIEHYTAL